MRRVIHGSLVVLLVFVALPAAADMNIGEAPVERSSPKHTITTNPLAMAFGVYNLEFERAVFDHLSFYVAPSYLGMDVLDTLTLHGFGLGGGLRLFLGGSAPEGFFVSPGIELIYVTVGESDLEASAMGWSANGILGYTWLVADIFAISLGGGVSYLSVEAEAEGRTLGTSTVVPSGRFAIGGAF